jgi:hypothetical protein
MGSPEKHILVMMPGKPYFHKGQNKIKFYGNGHGGSSFKQRFLAAAGSAFNHSSLKNHNHYGRQPLSARLL